MINAPKAAKHSSSPKRFRARLGQLAGLIAIFIAMMSFMTAGVSNAATTTCSSGASGSTTLPVTLEAGVSSTIWLQLSSAGTPDLEVKIDGNQCVRQTFTSNSNLNWQKFAVNVNFSQGTRQLTVSSFGAAATISKIAVVNDGKTPTGDGSNVTAVTNTSTCATAAPLGTATLNTSVEAGATNAVWLQLSNTSNADLEFKVDGNNCVRQTFSANANLTWVKFNSALTLSVGAHQIIVGSFSNGVLLTKIALVNDGQVPTGDGSNVIGTTTPTTQPPSTTQVTTTKPATTTTKAPVPTTQPVTTTTKLPNDVVIYTPGTHDDSALSYTGTWPLANNGAGENKYNGSDRYTTAGGGTATIKFDGTGIELYGANAPWHGKASISIDGGTAVEVDEYKSTRADQVLIFSKSGLPYGTHTLVLKTTGTKNSASTGIVIALDKVVVTKTTTTPTTQPVTTTTKAPVPTTQPATTTTKVSVPTTSPNTGAALDKALAKMKVDHNLASIKVTSYTNGILKARAYLPYTGLLYLGYDITATIAADGSYVITQSYLLASFTPIP